MMYDKNQLSLSFPCLKMHNDCQLENEKSLLMASCVSITAVDSLLGLMVNKNSYKPDVDERTISGVTVYLSPLWWFPHLL